VAVKVSALSDLLFSGEYDAVTGFGIEGSITILQLLRIRPPVVKQIYQSSPEPLVDSNYKDHKELIMPE